MRNPKDRVVVRIEERGVKNGGRQVGNSAYILVV